MLPKRNLFSHLKEIVDNNSIIKDIYLKKIHMVLPGIPLCPEKACKAIYDKKGVIEHAAASIPCAPSTIYRLMDSNPEVAFAVKEARELSDKERIDKNQVLKQKAYASAERLLDEGDVTQTIFTLKTLCGWNSGPSERSITINRTEKPYQVNVKDDRDPASV